MPASKGYGTVARVFVFLFGLPFVGGGVMALYAMLRAINRPGAQMKEILLPGIFGLAFTGVGALIWVASFSTTRKVAEAEKRSAAAPDKPWLWREDWARGRADGSTKSQQKFLWMFAIFWNLVSAPVLFFIPKEIPEKPIAAIGLLFPVVGVGMLIWAVRASMRARRFGATCLELSSLPAVPGGRLVGTIRARFPFPPTQGVQLQLNCLRRTITGSNRDRSTREDIVWRDERRLNANEALVAGGEASIPVSFAVPADALETTATDDNQAGILWVVTAAASLEGIDYQDDFEIPVYRTGASLSNEPADEFAASEPVFASDRATPVTPVSLEDLARAGITVKPAAEGIEYRFAAGRNAGFAAGLAAFATIWTAAVWFLIYIKAPWFFPVVFGLFDLLFLLIITDLLFGVTTLTVGNGVVRKLYTIFGLGHSSTIPLENIKAISLNINMQTSGRRGTPYYTLRATLINGRFRDLAGGIADKHQAEWLAGELRRAIGLSAS